jgi:hypothetical protein
MPSRAREGVNRPFSQTRGGPSRMASRTDAGPRVLHAKGVEWPHVQPHGEDPQVAPPRQEVLASPGREKTAGRRLRGVDWLNWPCGQNPGRKPEGRQRASTREAMSLGEQSSTCRASTL